MRGRVCRAPGAFQPGLSVPFRHNCGNPEAFFRVPGSQGCVGLCCQLGLWCNLPAEPLPELWVPLGVGKLSSATSPAFWRAGHTSQPCDFTHRKPSLGEVPCWVLRPIPVAH